MAALTLRGSIRVPGDKSISHRALMLSALAPGSSRVRHILDSADTRATADALRALGADVPPMSNDMLVVSAGMRALHSPTKALDCANSGTTTRLVAGIVAGLASVHARFIGDASLSRRPMRRVSAPLEAMGATFTFEGDETRGTLPMRVAGGALRPIAWENAHASAQVKSAILLAACVAGVEATVREPARSRDHTERMLASRGVALDVRDGAVRIHPAQPIAPLDVDVPADPSSAAFFLGLAALSTSSELRLTDVGLNPTRTGVIDVLRRMGARIEVDGVRDDGGEPSGTLVARPGTLNATHIGGREIPRCIDELPLLACVAAYATGTTIITDAAELRVKESDRIRAVVENLRAIGVDAEETADGMLVHGARKSLRGAVVTHGDHRLAMAFGVLGAIPGNDIAIDDPHCVDVSYPHFWRDLAAVCTSPS